MSSETNSTSSEESSSDAHNGKSSDTELNEMNFSEMLINVGGELLTSVNSRQEIQSRLDIIIIAWNMSLSSREDRKSELKRFIRKQKGVAPSKEALKALEAEIKRMIKQKISLYPEVDDKIVRAEALAKGDNDFEIKVYFQDKEKIAEAEAQSILLKGKAEAQAIEAKAKALKSNPLIVKLTEAQGWDGKLPTTIMGNTAMPIVDMRPSK